MNTNSIASLSSSNKLQSAAPQKGTLQIQRCLAFLGCLSIIVLPVLPGCLGDSYDDSILPRATQQETSALQPYEGRAVLGPLVDARVEVYEVAQQTGVPLFVTTTADADELGDAGRFRVDAELEPKGLYVLRVVGGFDIDPDDDGVRDDPPKTSLGTVHVLATGAQIAAGGFHVSVATEALFESVKYGLATGAPADAVLADANATAPSLIGEDITDDGRVDLGDVLAWDPALHEHALHPGSTTARALADDIHQDRSTTENARRLVRGTLASIDISQELASLDSSETYHHIVGKSKEAVIAVRYTTSTNLHRTALMWLDLGEPSYPKILGIQKIGNIDIETLQLLGTKHAVMRRRTPWNQWQIVDVSRTSKAQVVSTFTIEGGSNNFFVESALAVAEIERYIDDYEERFLQIFDLSEPATPKLASRIDLPFAWTDRGAFHLDGTYLYVIVELRGPSRLGMSIYDLSDPYAPVSIDTIALPGRHIRGDGIGLSIAASDEHLAVAIADQDFNDYLDGHRLFLFAKEKYVTSSSMQSLALCHTLNGMSSFSGTYQTAAFTENKLVVICNDGLARISGLGNGDTTTIAAINTWFREFVQVGNSLLVSVGNRIEVIDTNRLRNPVSAKTQVFQEIPGFSHPGAIRSTPNEVLVADACHTAESWNFHDCNEIFAVDAVSGVAPQTVYSGPFYAGFYVDNGLVLVRDSIYRRVRGRPLEHLATFDAPEPSEEGNYTGIFFPAGIEGKWAALVYLEGNEEHFHPWTGLAFFDISNPEAPRLAGYTHAGSEYYGNIVILRPPVAIVLRPEGGIAVTRLPDSSGALSLVGEVNIPGARTLAVEQNMAYVLAGGALKQLKTVSLANLSNPMVTSSVDSEATSWPTVGSRIIAYRQGFLYIVARFGAVLVYDTREGKPELFAVVAKDQAIENIGISGDKLYSTSKSDRLLVLKTLSPDSVDLSWLQ